MKEDSVFHTLASPLVIAHRGTSGTLPEHTLAAYELALRQGADAIELDLVSTRDGTLIARHDAELSLTTDVADRSEFRGRRRTGEVDGVAIDGWFVQDFTLDEARRLRARQRFAFRDPSHDGQYSVPTLDDVVALAARVRNERGRPVGVFVELKHASYFAGLGLALDELLMRALLRRDMAGRAGGVVIQSFETGVLQRLRGRTEVPLFQLLDEPHGAPYDEFRAGRGTRYADMASPAGLARIARYADGIGAWKGLIVPAPAAEPDRAGGSAPRLGLPTPLIPDAHAAGLRVCAWTFRDEPRFLAADYAGEAAREIERFARLGIDGLITDFPATALAACSRNG